MRHAHGLEFGREFVGGRRHAGPRGKRQGCLGATTRAVSTRFRADLTEVGHQRVGLASVHCDERQNLLEANHLLGFTPMGRRFRSG